MVRMAPTRLTAALLVGGLLLPSLGLAQKEVLFGTGKPVVYREEDVDRRFNRSKLARALAKGTSDPNCVQVLGALFTALGEVGPRLHRRDENFWLDPMVMQAVNTQVTNPRFPGNAYLGTMVRRLMLERKLPDEWLATAKTIEGSYHLMDMNRLKFLNDGFVPIDSFYFDLAAYLQRYELEVKRATSAAAASAHSAFRDAYLDREVAWGGAVVKDIGLARTLAKKNKGAPLKDEPGALAAILEWTLPAPPKSGMGVFDKPKGPTLKVFARLAVKQYVDLERLPRGSRVLVRGRFWEMSRDGDDLELRDALLFEDRNFSGGVVLAMPAAVLQCPFAVNDLTGLAPLQPGGFQQ